jgi:small-conductance mechanosensitive channel
VHTLPFGEIKQLTNYSRDWIIMKLEFLLAFGTDLQKVRKLVKKVGEELSEHPSLGPALDRVPWRGVAEEVTTIPGVAGQVRLPRLAG